MRRERAAAQTVLLVEHLNATREVLVQPHAQEVLGITHVAERLGKDFLAGHEPHNDVVVRWKDIGKHVDRAGADERLPAAGGTFAQTFGVPLRSSW